VSIRSLDSLTPDECEALLPFAEAGAASLTGAVAGLRGVRWAISLYADSEYEPLDPLAYWLHRQLTTGITQADILQHGWRNEWRGWGMTLPSSRRTEWTLAGDATSARLWSTGGFETCRRVDQAASQLSYWWRS
jgi:hypothetical protein